MEAAVQLYRECLQENRAGLLLSVGKWVAGDAANILPARAVLSGSIRSREQERLARCKERLVSLCAEKSKKGVTAHIRFGGECPPLANNAELLSLLLPHLTQNGFQTQKMPPAEGNAAEDFAVFAKEVPAVALAIAAGRYDRGYEYPLHHPRVLFDEDALPVGAAAYALAAITLGEGLQLQTFTKCTGA